MIADAPRPDADATDPVDSTAPGLRAALASAAAGAVAEPASAPGPRPVSAVGVDLVHVPDFGELLDTPGTTFATRVFTVGERAIAARRHLGGPALARHLAGRWAAKEAVVKAWSQAIVGKPPVIAPEQVDWRDIDIAADAWGRVAVRLSGEVEAGMRTSLSVADPSAHLRVNISHDGEYAVAVAVLAL